MITEGVFTLAGEFLALPSLDSKTVEEVFRRLLLVRLHQAERLSEGFMQRLLSWSPSGFSVFAEQLVAAHDTQRLERLARYMTRAPQRLDAIENAPWCSERSERARSTSAQAMMLKQITTMF